VDGSEERTKGLAFIPLSQTGPRYRPKTIIAFGGRERQREKAQGRNGCIWESQGGTLGAGIILDLTERLREMAGRKKKSNSAQSRSIKEAKEGQMMIEREKS